MISFQSFIQAIHDSVLEANLSLQKKNKELFDEFFEPSDDDAINQKNDTTSTSDNANIAKVIKHKPKIITIQYANETENGMEIKDVSVPLITLVPLSFSQISQVKMKTKLEILEIGDQLNVSFPSKSLPTNIDGSSSSIPSDHYTELEIILEPQKESEGLRKIVEGFEKMLRSQIPH